MSTITPILDTLLPQVLGRAGDIQRSSTRLFHGPVAGVLSVKPTAAGTRQNDPHLAKPTPGSGKVDETGAAKLKTDANTRAAQAGGERAAAARGDPAQVGSTRAHLSRAAQTIATLMQGTSDAATAARPGRHVLLQPGQPATPAAVSALLGQQVANSGVFYESHLLRWVQGNKSLAQLLKQPQAQLNTRGANSPAPPSAQTSDSAQSSARPGTNAAQSGSANSLLSLGNASHTAANTTATGAHALIDERLLPVVRHQLDVLNTSAFQWQGQAWPGAPMQWRIAEHTDWQQHQSSDSRQPQRRYTTAMNLDLPSLGGLEVRLTLADKAVHIQACARDPDSAATLEAGKDDLRQRLRRAGFDSAVIDLVAGRRA